jgi:hypothetical protein
MKVGCRRPLPARLSGDRAAGGLERRLSREAASCWHQTDEQVMAGVAFIPLQTQLTPLFRSRRVSTRSSPPSAGAAPSPRSGSPDEPLRARYRANSCTVQRHRNGRQPGSRLCAHALGGQILLSPRAYTTVSDLVDVEPAGPLQLKGFQDPVQAYNVTGLRA